MAVGEAREGYELWRPNREKSSSLSTRFVVMLLLLVSTALMLLILIGGLPVLVGGTTFAVIGFLYAALYVLLAVLVARWSRGALTVSAAAAVFLTIFCAVGANSWFARAKDGFESGAIGSDVIGVLVVLLIPIQLALIAVAMIGFNQEWHVEEERPLSGGGDPAADPGDRSPQPA